jgi:hypothetical protein
MDVAEVARMLLKLIPPIAVLVLMLAMAIVLGQVPA